MRYYLSAYRPKNKGSCRTGWLCRSNICCCVCLGPECVLVTKFTSLGEAGLATDLWKNCPRFETFAALMTMPMSGSKRVLATLRCWGQKALPQRRVRPEWAAPWTPWTASCYVFAKSVTRLTGLSMFWRYLNRSSEH